MPRKRARLVVRNCWEMIRYPPSSALQCNPGFIASPSYPPSRVSHADDQGTQTSCPGCRRFLMCLHSNTHSGQGHGTLGTSYVRSHYKYNKHPLTLVRGILTASGRPDLLRMRLLGGSGRASGPHRFFEPAIESPQAGSSMKCQSLHYVSSMIGKYLVGLLSYFIPRPARAPVPCSDLRNRCLIPYSIHFPGR